VKAAQVIFGDGGDTPPPAIEASMKVNRQLSRIPFGNYLRTIGRAPKRWRKVHFWRGELLRLDVSMTGLAGVTVQLRWTRISAEPSNSSSAAAPVMSGKQRAPSGQAVVSLRPGAMKYRVFVWYWIPYLEASARGEFAQLELVHESAVIAVVNSDPLPPRLQPIACPPGLVCRPPPPPFLAPKPPTRVPALIRELPKRSS
jgi:hypothetical protein